MLLDRGTIDNGQCADRAEDIIQTLDTVEDTL